MVFWRTVLAGWGDLGGRKGDREFSALRWCFAALCPPLCTSGVTFHCNKPILYEDVFTKKKKNKQKKMKLKFQFKTALHYWDIEGHVYATRVGP